MSMKSDSKYLGQLSGIFLVSIILLMAGANVCQAAINWTNNGGTGDQHWSTATNWEGGVVPSVSEDAAIILTDSNGVIYDATDDDGGSPRYVFFIPIGLGTAVSGEMWINGGTLMAPWGLTFNKSGDATSDSTLHMSGGSLLLGPWPGYGGASQGYLALGRAGSGTCNMTGGRIECVQLRIPDYAAAISGEFNLDGGVVIANDSINPPLNIRTTGVLNITAGKLILDGDETSLVNGYVGTEIIPYPDFNSLTERTMVVVDYDVRSDSNTTVTAEKYFLTQAFSPEPMDEQPKIEASVALSWAAGDDVASHEIYIGTSWADVNEALVPTDTNDINTYSLNDLVLGETYYWRIDEVNDINTYTGKIWSFTTKDSPLAVNPSPGDEATGVDIDADILWSEGVGSVSNDIYFGISFNDVNDADDPNALPGRGRSDANSYEPGTLAAGQTYYWRVDEVNEPVINRGAIWSFTTEPAAAAAVVPPYMGDIIGYGDGAVTLDDMELLAFAWLSEDCNAADISGDCDVDFVDYAYLGGDWPKTAAEYKGSVYYVTTSGDDGNPGTEASPWATIQKAGEVMVAGDTVVVAAGTYYGQVTVANSGDSQGCGLGDMPITFLADQLGGVILDANDSANNGFYIVGRNYVVIDGFEITGGRDGIFFDGDGYTYHVIRNCEIYDNGRDGIRAYEADKVTIEGSLLYGNTDAGIRTISTVNDLEVSGCTIYDNNDGLYLAGNSLITDCIITNNTTEGVIGDASGDVVTYCDVWGNGTNYSGATAGTGCISADPCFVNPGVDFGLLAGSSCIAAASDGEDMGYAYPPIANAGMDQTVQIDEVVTFDGSASRGNIVSYTWDFNDLSAGSGKVATHTYTSVGTYTVSLDVNDGTTIDVGTCTVDVLAAKALEIVYHVTNLNVTGTGSFRDCLSRANSDGMPSRIVFNVGGTIYPGTSLALTADNTTICGTEAPSPGVTVNFGGPSGTAGITISGDNCRMCNIHITDTRENNDGVRITGDGNVVERCTMTWCRDEGAVIEGGVGNVLAFNRIEFCGSQPGDDSGGTDGRGLSVWKDSEATVVGNYIGDNLRGALCGDYGTDNFMDFRNNLVTKNHQTFALKVSNPSNMNIIDNSIVDNTAVGIKYADGAIFYRSGNILSGNTGGDETYVGGINEASSPFTRVTTPYPDWLKDVVTPADKTQTGMGSGKCQCVLCR